jgi:hypothetical protein
MNALGGSQLHCARQYSGRMYNLRVAARAQLAIGKACEKPPRARRIAVRLILFFVGTMGALAVGVSQGLIPLPAQMSMAVRGFGGDPTHGKTVNFSPVDYNRALPEILRGNTPEEPGIHGAPATKLPGSLHGLNSAAVNAGAAAQNGFASGLVSQMQQNNQRMQDAATYARKP